MPVIPLECPFCENELRVDSDESAAVCSHCGKPFVVKDAIVQNYIRLLGSKAPDNEKALTYEEFVIEDGILKRYNGASQNVVIPDEVTVIGSRAFEDCRNIFEVRLSDHVMEIEDNAFSGCVNLQEIGFSGSVKKIGSYAFSECSGLKTVDLPYTLEEIGPYAFSGCFMLISVRMPSSQSNVHETAFTGNKDVRFEWPDDWANKQMDKLKIAAPAQGGMIRICDPDGTGDTNTDTLLFFGISDLGMYVESTKYNFYTYRGFMNMFSLGKNNDDPYLLRVSVDNAQQRYEAVADIQKSYSELIALLDRADISRSVVEMINIPHFIWRPGKRLNDYKVVDIGNVPVLQIKLIQE